ncbi:ATP-binding protein [Peribacillus glennii]|uniref:YhaN AAA domain-containing protein n=1 Tax=Peribacillus glennii TaxID=2303991 RepID=A0A372L9U9_9BACI|nr:AAA family ATPase [Peribacillus glennii]RFU62106.1 hypothetical protein D0466_16115 [Peribacillus glennii]
MKIKELHIYGYGKFENKKFTEFGQLQIFFGENESGKSTVMSFIHSILFGFPTKVQNEKRYEPKLNAKYGGKIIILSERYGEVSIERVKGKAAGDVTVGFENGTVGDEGDLRDLLQGIDKQYFQSVFSFDLQGLHGVQNVGEATLAKYLLSAGMVGSDLIVEAETKLQKELDARFKPSGQKPELNVRLKHLKELQARLKKSEEEERAYKELQKTRSKTEDQLSKLKMDISANEEKLFQYQEFLRIRPIIEQKQILKERLDELDNISFPADGIKRLDQLNALKIPNDAQLSAMHKKKQKIDGKIAELTISSYIEANREKIASTLDRTPYLEQLESEKSRLEEFFRSKEKEKSKYKLDLFLDKPEEEIAGLDTSVFTAEKIKQLEQEKHRLKSDRLRLDEKYKHEKSNLEAVETRIAGLKEKQLPDEERKRLEEAYQSNSNEKFARVKAEFLEEQIRELKQRYSKLSAKEQTNKKRTGILVIILTAICIAMSLYAWNHGQSFVAVAAVLFAGAVLLVQFYFKGNNMLEDLKKQLNEAEDKKKQHERQANSGQAMDLSSIRNLLQNEEDIQRQYIAEEVKRKERSAAFDSVIKESEKWEVSWNHLTEEIKSIHKKWGIAVPSTDYSTEVILDQLILLKQAIQESDQAKKEILKLDKKITNHKEELLAISKEIGASTSTWHEALVSIKQLVALDSRNRMQLDQIHVERQQIDEEIARLQSESAYLSAEIGQLFEGAGVQNEEEFRKKAMDAEEQENLKSNYHMVSLQLSNTSFNLNELLMLSDENVSKYTIEALETERRELLTRQSGCFERLSDLKHKIERLEEGGSYIRILHQFHEERAAFNEEAKEWAKYALAKRMLNDTIAAFKRERLPKVIEKAQEYLSFLTDGEYKRIILRPTSEGLDLERRDGLRFEAWEVSRGTAEQVYVSLRLALAGSMLDGDGFPIIIDDSFVNFDRNRTLKVIRLLKKISGKRQVIFFTCHEHLLSFFENTSITAFGKESIQS